jgi:hypothetical protein
VQADAKERFMECKVAYQTLSDATQRAKFDRQQVSRGATVSDTSTARPLCLGLDCTLSDYACGYLRDST